MKSKMYKPLSSVFLAVFPFIFMFFSCKDKKEISLAVSERVNQERIRKIDVKHQILDLEFDWNQKQVKGSTSITFSNLTTSDTLYLDSGMLSIHNVRLANGTKLDFEYDGSDEENGLKIVLNKPYPPDEDLTVEIDYHSNRVNQSDPSNIWGSFGKGIRFFEPSLTEKERRKQIWAVGEAQTNKYWYPCYDAPNDFRTTEFIATVAKPLMAISNGKLIDIKDNEDGTRTFYWKTDTPHANHLTSFVIGEYQNYQQAYRNIELNNYGYPDEYIGTKESVIRLPDMMEFFSNITDREYPFESYSQIFVQDFGGWKGNMMTSTITENMIDDKTTHEDFLYLWDITESEALAHQWFGNLISVKDWSHSWLSKGFSRHLAAMYNEHKNGREEFLLYQHSPDMNTYFNDWNSNTRIPIVTDGYDDVEAFVNGNSPYIKGALVLNMLRSELGEEKWKRVIKEYVNTYAGKLVYTQDFIAIVNQVNNQQMDWFFNQWVYGIGHPVFKVEHVFDKEQKQLKLHVDQVQKMDSVSHYKQTEFFQGKMKIEIDGKVEEIQLQPIKQNSYVFNLEKKPRFVNFDFEDVWIKQVRSKPSQEELIAELKGSNDILGKVAAMGKLSTIAKGSTTSKELRAKIKNELRKVILSKQYWRTRLNALWQFQGLLPSTSTDRGIAMENETIEMLKKLIKKEKSWLKSNAINVLGLTRDSTYTPIYLEALHDYSDRVVNTAAIAIGKTKNSKAFDALIRLKDKPSWKNQSLISALYGLKELEDPRAYDLAIQSLTDSDNPHWNLGTPIWDHRLAAAHTLVAIDKADKGYPAIYAQFQDALKNENVNDIFYNAMQVSILGDPRGQVVFEELHKKFSNDKNALKAIVQLKNTFNNTIKNQKS